MEILYQDSQILVAVKPVGPDSEHCFPAQLLEALGGRSDLRPGGGTCQAVLPPTMPPQPHSGTPSMVSEVAAFTRSR